MQDILKKMLNLNEDQYDDLRSTLIDKMYDLGYAFSGEQRLDDKRILSFRKSEGDPEIDIVIKNERTS